MGDGMFLVTLSQPQAWLAGQTQITGNKLLDKLTPDDTTAVPDQLAGQQQLTVTVW